MSIESTESNSSEVEGLSKKLLSVLTENNIGDFDVIKNVLEAADKDYKTNPDFIKNYNRAIDRLVEDTSYATLYGLISTFKVETENAKNCAGIEYQASDLFEESLDNAISRPTDMARIEKLRNATEVLRILGGVPENILELARITLQEKNVPENIFLKIREVVSSGLEHK